jgi:hypothetical protein
MTGLSVSATRKSDSGHCENRVLRFAYPYLLFFFALCLPAGAQAHDLGQSYIFLTVAEESVSGRFEITISDLNKALGIALETDHSLIASDFEPYIEPAKAYLAERILVAADGTPAQLIFGEVALQETTKAQYMAINFDFGASTNSAQTIDFVYTVLFDVDPDHRGFVVVENNWKAGTFNNEAVISLIFDPGTTTGRLDLSASTVLHGFWEMTKLGVHHIWVGIDHIMFLLALLLPSVVLREQRQWRASESFRYSLIYVVKIVTLFTVAHTITLSAATLGAITISSRVVESVIAISIAIAAADVLWPIFRGHIWWVVFAFGLFHGMGFATVLSEIGVPPAYMMHSLLAFNIGVELGQLAIVAAVFPLLYLMRRGWFYQRVALPIAAGSLIVVSIYWFVERGFLIDLPAGEYANWIVSKVGARG